MKIKKLLSVILATVLILSMSVSAFAQAQEVTITVHNDAEILAFFNSDEYDANNRYTFITESAKSTRAICYNCGRPNMGIIKKEEQVSGQTQGCPYNSLDPDVFSEFEVNEYERCTACDFENFIQQVDTRYYADCNGKVWRVKEEYTIEQGYDPHQCLSTWM